KEHCFRELLAEEGGALIHDVLAAAATGHNHHERLRRGITRFVVSCFERSDVARLLIVESVGLSAGVEALRHELQAKFADGVAANAWNAIQTTVRAMGSPSSPALKPTVSSSTQMLRPRSRMARPRAWASRRRRFCSFASSWPGRRRRNPAMKRNTIPP